MYVVLLWVFVLLRPIIFAFHFISKMKSKDNELVCPTIFEYEDKKSSQDKVAEIIRSITNDKIVISQYDDNTLVGYIKLPYGSTVVNYINIYISEDGTTEMIVNTVTNFGFSTEEIVIGGNLFVRLEKMVDQSHC